jgi:hypothetical protein
MKLEQMMTRLKKCQNQMCQFKNHSVVANNFYKKKDFKAYLTGIGYMKIE